MRTSRLLVILSTALLALINAGALHASALDSTLYTTYSINTAHTGVNWIVCGSTQGSSGCYSSGSIGPFGKVGAIMEGNPSTNLAKGTVTRNIYFLDIASGTGANGVVLFVYKKVDTISSTYDSVIVTLSKTVDLPLTGGSTALASMAANAKFLFVGTNQSPQAVEIQKSNLVYTSFGGFSPPVNVTAITADPYGYVTVSFGSFGGGESGIYVMGPDGTLREDGGGAYFMLNTVQAVLPATLP